MNAYTIRAMLVLTRSEVEVGVTLDIAAESERDAITAALHYNYPQVPLPIYRVDVWECTYQGEVPCDEDDHTAEVLGCTYAPAALDFC